MKSHADCRIQPGADRLVGRWFNSVLEVCAECSAEYRQDPLEFTRAAVTRALPACRPFNFLVQYNAHRSQFVAPRPA